MKTWGDRVSAMLADYEDAADLTTFKWTASGEYYKEGSSDPWRGETQGGVIEADHPAVALLKLVTGYGPGTTIENTPDWSLMDADRPITFTIEPAEPDLNFDDGQGYRD